MEDIPPPPHVKSCTTGVCQHCWLCQPAVVWGKAWGHRLPVPVVPAHGPSWWVWAPWGNSRAQTCRWIRQQGVRQQGRRGCGNASSFLNYYEPTLGNPSRRLCPGSTWSAPGGQKSVLGLCCLVEPPVAERSKAHVESNLLAFPNLTLNGRATAHLSWMS